MDNDDFRLEIRRLKREIEDLERENARLSSKLCSANFKIETELEPRIKRERRVYDNWVTDPER